MGWPVQALQRATTNGEWLKWMRFMRQEPNLFHREDWYWAKIAATIKATRGVTVAVADELIPFSFDGKATKKRRHSRFESKVFWTSYMGSFAADLLEEVNKSEGQ